MTTINAPDTIFCQESLPDELCRRASSSYLNDKPSLAAVLSGITHARDQDVVCLLLLKRRLVVPYSGTGAAEEALQ